MSCENSIRMRNPRYSRMNDELFWREYYRVNFNTGLPDLFIDVPCGKCHSCRKQKANAWRLRLNSEFEKYPNSVFITLTFNNEYLRRFKYEPNRAVRLWLDRIRKRLGKQVRHFVIGEYGETTNRFHYHGILFDVPDNFTVDTLSETWQYGFCYIGWCTKKTITYILKYITKVDDSGKTVKIPRIVASKGLGVHFVEQYRNEPLKTRKMPFLTVGNGAKIPLPRYIKQKMFDEDELCQMRVSYYLKPFERYVNGVRYTDPVEYRIALKEFFNRQVSLKLSARPEKKIKTNSLAPVEVRHLEPYSLDFYSPNEKRQLESDFSISEKVPF